MYVISLVFSFVICFIILVVSGMSGAAWPGARRLLPPRVVRTHVCTRARAHMYAETKTSYCQIYLI